MLNNSFVIIFTTLFSLVAYAEGNRTPHNELPKIIVFDIKPEKGVDSGSANLLTEIVLDEVTSITRERYRVIGQKDIDKMLFWETNKSLKNCNDSSCLMQIAGALGADYYVEGSVGILGKKYVLTLKFIDAYKVEILGRKTEVMEKGEEDLIKVAKAAVRDILKIKTEKKEIITTKDKEGGPADIEKSLIDQKVRGRILWKKIVGFSLLGVGLVSGITGTYFYIKAKDIERDDSMTRDEADMAGQNYKNNMLRAEILGAMGIVFITSGTGILIFGNNDKSDLKVTIMPFKNNILTLKCDF